MIITEIIVEGFRSFREPQHFYLPKEPGLYFMRGENRKEPRLGSNGAGKSTMWEALCWALFGKTSRSLKAGATGTWGMKKGTRVTICFEGELNGASNWYFLTRTWKPNSWTLANLFDATPIDLTKDETNPILAMLRLQYEPFLHCIFMAQREEMFLDLKPEPKAQLFSSVMDLDRWLNYSNDASAAASDQDRISRRLESERAELKGRLEESGTESLERSEEEFERKRRESLAELERTYIEITRRSKKAKQAYEDAKDAEARTFERTKALLAARDEALNRDEEVRRRLRKAEDDLLELRSDLKHAQEHREAMLRDEGCPTCGRLFDVETQAGLEVKADRDARNAQTSVDCQQDLVDDLQREADYCNSKLEEADQAYRAGQDAQQGAQEAVRIARRSHELEERHLDDLEDESERLEAERNPFSGMLSDRRDGLARLREDYEVVCAKLDQSYERHALYSFWVRGFKEVRLQLIAEALEQLEIEVNSELMALGLLDWELHFDVDAETKKGTLSRGFSVSVLSPHNQERVEWESWSGGESQRLRLAAQCGLANLIRDRTGCDLPLEIWDEPTEGLSEEGITDLLTALSERAIREGRCIWIVDHRALGFGGFSGTATIIKDEKGSRVVQARV